MTETPKELTDLPEYARPVVPLDLLSDVLSMVRLTGALFLRAEFTAPWAYESPPAGDLKQLLGPRANHLILFHLIAEGSCWIRVSGGEQVLVSAGEVVVLPYGDQHVVGSTIEVVPVSIGALLSPP